MMGPHILGSTGQLMIRPNPKDFVDELWYCPFDVSFPAHTPQWERVPIDSERFRIGDRLWERRQSIWSVRDMVNSIIEDRQPQLGGAAALTSLECVFAVYESHFTGARATLPLIERRPPACQSALNQFKNR